MSNIDLKFDDVPALPDIESIINRANYHSSLYFSPKHKHRKFGKIVAPYHLKLAKIKCGISDCGTKHLHGYVITTSDGLETNIGKDCGTLHFKADFATEMKRHDDLYNRRLKIHRILELKGAAPETLAVLLSAKNEYSILKSLRYSLRAALSATENQHIAHKLKTKDSNLYRYESRSLAEREAYFETNPAAKKSGVVPPNQIKIGEIAGFDFLNATHRDEEVFNFATPLRNVISASVEDIYSWRTGEIDKVHIWIGKANKGLERINYLISSGKKFFTKDNVSGLGAAGLSAESVKSAINIANSLRS
ncbi:hypothetical protein PMI35_01182 [Pseudomonas sp. GM78]|uniref:hypothetical protein n=1 Tax=Pseudomonas sp. GM78 TaxID=1144337 RepID=UPI00026F7440|nr:hypothetical protein [Pseudomonas sp. GM78]EJN31901.1 hypothetical protein PMI35_01182 [Pseudomonas sp. GM78]